jgi:hypothetical protein
MTPFSFTDRLYRATSLGEVREAALDASQSSMEVRRQPNAALIALENRLGQKNLWATLSSGSSRLGSTHTLCHFPTRAGATKRLCRIGRTYSIASEKDRHLR